MGGASRAAAVTQGTGMSVQEAQAMRIADLPQFRQYVEAVWASTKDYLSNPDESVFDTPVMVKPLGRLAAFAASPVGLWSLS